MSIKDVLKSRRLELGYTMKELADLVGVSEGTISRWESGDIANMRRDKIVSLAKALRLSPSVIMEWDETNEDTYYIDKDAREYAEFLYKNPEYRVLFDASRKVKAEDIEFVRQMIDRLGGNDNDDTGA